MAKEKPLCPRCQDEGIDSPMDQVEARVANSVRKIIGRRCDRCGLKYDNREDSK